MKPQAKTLLVADVGGTNTRFALADDMGLHSVEHLSNVGFDTFDDVLRTYLAQTSPGSIDACCVAMAGPVHAGEGTLTNLDWQLSTSRLRQGVGCDHAMLLNDLSALGYALPDLPPSGLMSVYQPKAVPDHAQSLVIGIGTGFNLCPVRRGANGATHCFEVEMGHAALPAPLRDSLEGILGAKAGAFPTLEHLFSGNGLAHFHHEMTGIERTGKQITQAHLEGAPEATQTLQNYTSLLALLCRELAYHYMPMGGMYFAGSVARGILTPEFHSSFSAQACSDSKVGDLFARIPKWVMLEDAAALYGCRAALKPAHF